MLFNSLAFLLFLPVVFGLYWSFRSAAGQNRVVVVASMFFYGWWDWRFLLLMVATCVADYWFAQAIERSAYRKRRKHWLLAAIVVNMGLLGVFKYFNFFADNLAEIFSWLGIRADIPTLHIILPIGISFYTFQLTAYVVDVYRGQLRACRSLELFLSFICFFPQLVAGPIERGANLLPQFAEKRVFDYSFAVDGMRLFLWGLMKKMLVADNCAPVADYVFGNYQSLATVDLWIGLFAFTVQVYCDFSGYSDMAIGSAKLFGIRLSTNFNHPFFAVTIRDFWRRWHMTLMGWLRDYVYFPLGVSRCSPLRHYFNVFALYMLSGLWHGPNWSFIVWGTWNGLFNVTTKNMRMPRGVSWFVTIMVFMLSQVFFRNPTVTDGFEYFGRLFAFDGTLANTASRIPLLLAAALFLTEYATRNYAHPFQFCRAGSIWRWRMSRFALYAVCFACCVLLGGQQVQFIYFQF